MQRALRRDCILEIEIDYTLERDYDDDTVYRKYKTDTTHRFDIQ